MFIIGGEQMTNLTNPIFQDADKAREHLEKQRWPDGPECPHCGCVGDKHITAIKNARARPSKANPDGALRKGLYQCNGCRKQFTVTVGTVFERSKVPLNKWLLATFLLTSSKKGMSAHQLHRTIGVTYKTAWFMFHRIREAMKDDKGEPLGGEGKVVEADETYIGKRDVPYQSPRRDLKKNPYTKKGRGGGNTKNIVIGLVERGGETRLFHVQRATKQTVREILVRNASRKSKLFTDESRLYTTTGDEYAQHRTTNHASGEYVRGEVHSNTIENVFSVFKRGMRGVYQHCGEAHLQRYLTEFGFRFNHRTKLGVTDAERFSLLLQQIEGKRLTYRRTGSASLA
jgi:transposase-like protein